MTDNNTPNPNAGQDYQEMSEHPRRRTPRRNGKGSNAAANQNALAVKNGGEVASIAEADDLALSAGGSKAVGRIFPFMKLEKPMAFLSLFLVVASIVLISVKGLNLGLDFTGGVSADVVYEQSVDSAEVESKLIQAGFDKPQVQYLGTRNELLVRLPPQTGEAAEITQKMNEALTMPSNPVKVDNLNIIGGQLGDEIYLNSLFAMAAALGAMLLYVAIQFQFKLGLGANLSLFHDVIVTLGIFALFQWPFDLTVLAAILALIGYSLNDTIVVYDRIRENFRRVRGLSPRKVVDLSLTETLRRTFMTSGTVLVVVVAMLFLGGDGLYWFSMALFIGLIAGTYSSMYIASSVPLMMGLSREDFVVKIKPEFMEEEVVFADPNLQKNQPPKS